MKNREKAEECAKKYSTRYDTITAEGNIIESSNYLNCLRSAIAMAEWKDEQFQEEKKKVVEWLSLNAELYGGFNGGKLNEMVCKLKKAMEE